MSVKASETLATINNAKTEILENINSAGEDALSDLESAKTETINNIYLSRDDAVDYVIETVGNQADSALAISNQAKEDIENSKASIDDALALIFNGQIGMTWVEFSENDWTEDENGLFKFSVTDMPAVSNIYKKKGTIKSLIFGVNVDIDENDTAVLYATEKFDGYVLGTRNLIDFSGEYMEDEDDNEFTDEELEALKITDWEDIGA